TGHGTGDAGKSGDLRNHGRGPLAGGRRRTLWRARARRGTPLDRNCSNRPLCSRDDHVSSPCSIRLLAASRPCPREQSGNHAYAQPRGGWAGLIPKNHSAILRARPMVRVVALLLAFAGAVFAQDAGSSSVTTDAYAPFFQKVLQAIQPPLP